MKTYIKPRNLKIQNMNDQFVLSKGFLHRQMLSIDKEESSTEFVEAFTDFIRQGEIVLSENSEVNDDFYQLTQFNLINQKFENLAHTMIIVEDIAVNFLTSFLDKDIRIIPLSEFFSTQEIKMLNNNSDTLALEKTKEKFSTQLKDTELYFISSYQNLSAIRAFNKLTKLIDRRYTLFFYDDNNIFATLVVHGQTGCYECLEKQIIEKFSGTIDSYFDDAYNKELEFDIDMYGFIISILKNEIKSNQIFGNSTLIGNVLHFYTSLYEYNFNFNKRQTSCTTCANLNNVLFSEQNMKSTNILRKVLSE